MLPRTSTVMLGPRAFCSSGPASWNSLPVHLRHCDLTIGAFKWQLKTVLFGWVSPLCRIVMLVQSPRAPMWRSCDVNCAHLNAGLLLLLRDDVTAGLRVLYLSPRTTTSATRLLQSCSSLLSSTSSWLLPSPRVCRTANQSPPTVSRSAVDEVLLYSNY